MAKLVTGTYGEALYELAVEEKKEKEFLSEVTSLIDILKENPDFSAMMNHPKLLKEEKAEALEKVMRGNFSDELTGFMLLVLNKDRYSEIDGILEFFVSKMKEHLKIGTAYVKSAVALKDSQKKEIEQKLLATTKYETMEIDFETDESLIGGLIIRIGDRVVDSSIRSKLDKLTRELQDVQISNS
ncbi:MAG: ATP synthase F1 subunit delta [Lachnospiraceae bacterium]|nr:ATP synthase F1 subunit delta [Lachnospiraceae bacterium]